MNQGIWVSTEDLNREKSFVAAAEQEFSMENLADEQGAGRFETNRRDFLKLMGFGLGAATIAASCEIPMKKAIPYVTKPDEIVPGVANYFATTFVNGGDVVPVLVKTREGRPIKIEGNTLSPMTGGGTSARAQASVLSLYDGKRLKNAGKVDGDAVSDLTWLELDRAVKGALANAQQQGKGIRVITSTNVSPTAAAAMSEFLAKYPTAKVVKYDPVSSAALLLANEQCFGIKAVPAYHFDQADTIVSFGADFLGTWISPVEYAKDYAKNRKVDPKHPKKSRHYQIESAMSMTGSNADNRILVRPSEQGAAILALWNALSGGSSSLKVNDKAAAAIQKLAAELKAAPGKSLVVSGSNNVQEQILVNKINALLGNYGTSISWHTASTQRQGNEADMATCISEMNGGQVGVAIVWNANPAYDWRNSVQFKEAFAKVGTRVACALSLDETASLCSHVAPTHHFLESWGDAQLSSGQFSLVQPTIAPLFNTRQAEHSLLEWCESTNLNRAAEQPFYEYLKSQWLTKMKGLQSKYLSDSAFWDMSLHDGVLNVETVSTNPVIREVAVDTSKISQPSTAELEISFYETVNIGNGQYAHNPWLQEMPDPVLRTVWGNYLSIPVEWDGNKTINGWQKMNDGDIVSIEINGTKQECQVVKTFGQMPGTVAIGLGGGRTAGGTGKNFGINVNDWLTVGSDGLTQYFNSNVKIEVVERRSFEDKFASVQNHHTMGLKAQKGDKTINADEEMLAYQGSLVDRSIIFNANLKELPKFEKEMAAFHKEADHLNSNTLYPDNQYWFDTGIKWGMYVDTNSCIGCGACQVACVSENNVPLVGKTEVSRHHEMTWMRIDRYFYGDLENPRVVYQPMMCQHCDNAPCENVCPVNATNHSMEGINQMAYNRCIGTRYCANNCPYKVRRFNWLDYTTADVWPANEEKVFWPEGDNKPFYADNLVRMVLNPDVTVRTRGVIEKCTFCIQRIQEGKLTAKRENRELQDNDVRSACQTACPTGAITFGNVNNPDSAVSKKIKEAGVLAYQVLEEINVKPGVRYGSKISNSNEELFS